MIEEQPVPSALRVPWWLVAILLVVGVGVGFGVGALVWAGDSAEPARAQESPGDGGPANTSELCLNVYFGGADPDPAMRAAADQLRVDPRIEAVTEVTQAEAFVEFKEIFADEPKMLELAHEESMPAVVRVKVRESGTEKQVKDQLTEKFPESDVAEGACKR